MTRCRAARRADVFHWDIDDEGPDIVTDFNVNADELSFEDGYFFGEDEAWFDIEDMLFAAQQSGQTRLYAFRDDGALDDVAVFEGVSVAALNQRIANGSIFGGQSPFETSGFETTFGGVSQDVWDMLV